MDPRQGDLHGGDALSPGDPSNGVGDPLVGPGCLRGKAPAVAAEVLVAQRVGLDRAGQEPPAERGVGHQSDSELSQRIQDLGLGVAGPQGVLGLDRGDGVHGVGAPEQLAVHLGESEVTDLPGLDQLGHRRDGRLDLGILCRRTAISGPAACDGGGLHLLTEFIQLDHVLVRGLDVVDTGVVHLPDTDHAAVWARLSPHDP